MTVPSVDGRPIRVGLCIPTLNPGRWAKRLVTAVSSQTLRPDFFLVIDSSSTDGSLEHFASGGAEVVRIPRDRFDHGGTRNLAMDRSNADVQIYMTQDAIPTNEHAFATLVDGLLAQDRIGLAYGRQLAGSTDPPHVRAHRAFNYPAEPAIRTADDVKDLGVRAAFSSHSFAAYRREALDDIGRFPPRIIGSEDRWAAARLLQRGWSVAYVPEACVDHSHDYGLAELFRRYFDIGVFHATERWFDEWLGRPEREGMSLIRKQVATLRGEGVRFPLLRQTLRSGASWMGFRTGRASRLLPRAVCRAFTTNRAYW